MAAQRQIRRLSGALRSRSIAQMSIQSSTMPRNTENHENAYFKIIETLSADNIKTN